MREMTPDNAVSRLRELGWLRPGSEARVDWLAWGVSNVVLLVTPQEGAPFVVKQSREQLRTKADWFSRLDRIWREIDVMRALQPLLPAGAVPQILFEAREDYLFGMEAIDPRHTVWKAELLAGTADPAVSLLAARMLAAIHRETYHRLDLRDAMGDREVFDQLRLDPFYRRVAAVHADLKPIMESLIAETLSRQDCVVHADFSPKNLLIVREPDVPARLSLVDYETGHFGDPAFDLGFFLSHLLLKTIRQAGHPAPVLLLARLFWADYRRELASLAVTEAFGPGRIDRRVLGHLAGCLLARIDGKSTVDYLTAPSSQDLARSFSRSLFLDPPDAVDDAFDRLQARLLQTSLH